MASNVYQKFYQQLTKKVLDKIVTPKILGEPQTLESTLNQQKVSNTPVCYVLQDDSTSNKVLIDNETEKLNLDSAFAPLILKDYQEKNSFLTLNETNKSEQSHYFPDKLVRMIEYLVKHPEADILLVPVTILWGRAPEYEDRWYKVLMSDAWSKPSKIKQALNITLYGRENYIEFHSAISLRELIATATEKAPHFSPAHSVLKHLNQSFDQYKQAILGPDLSDRRNVINKLMLSEAVKTAVRTESIQNKISLNQAESLARSYLDEIVSDFSYSAIRFAEIALTKLWTQLYDGIEVHHFETVRELSKDYELIYTPCHRSHIDYLLLSFVIYKRGLMVPHIAAGINLNMPMVGQLFRGVGAYFIRRSFNGNALYTSVFKEYLHSLLERNTPLEYFIEGGRSRTGRLLPAKKGMLAMTIQSHLRGSNNKPIVFIPTYFGYEKLLEGSSYIKELSGQPKQAESLFGILKSIKKIEKVFGYVHVNFGEPVFLEPILKQNNVLANADVMDEPTDSIKQTVNLVAQNILENINKAVVINPVDLIALVLLNAPTHSLAERDVLLGLEQFRLLLNKHAYDERMKITTLSNQQIIQYAIKLKQVEFIEHDNERWIKVCDKQEALLTYFSNNILHTFILPAYIAFALKQQLFVANEANNDIREFKKDLLLEKVVDIYPDLQKAFFLKWSISELNHQFDEIINHYYEQQLIQINSNEMISLTERDENLRLLFSFAHLYEMSLVK